MKTILRCVICLLFVAGIVSLVWLTRENGRVADDIERLEAELGRMFVNEIDRVHIVAIKEPRMPAEVASHVQRLWQYRLYLPAGYDYLRSTGHGRLAEQGAFLQGSYGTSWSSPNPEAMQMIVTISLSRDGDQIRVFLSSNGSVGTTSWNRFSPEQFQSDELVVQTLTDDSQDSQSFDQSTILPLLRIYDPKTAKKKTVAGNEITTYAGGLILLCPKSRESELNDLRAGRVPDGFEASWIAKGHSHE